MSFNKRYFGEGFFGNKIPDAAVGVKDDEEVLEAMTDEVALQAMDTEEIVKVLDE